jgi:hypothetical protein
LREDWIRSNTVVDEDDGAVSGDDVIDFNAESLTGEMA